MRDVIPEHFAAVRLHERDRAEALDDNDRAIAAMLDTHLAPMPLVWVERLVMPDLPLHIVALHVFNVRRIQPRKNCCCSPRPRRA